MAKVLASTRVCCALGVGVMIGACGHRQGTWTGGTKNNGVIKRDVTAPQAGGSEQVRLRDPRAQLLPRIDSIIGRPIAVVVPMSVLSGASNGAGKKPGKSGPFAVLLDDGTKLKYRVFEVTIAEQSLASEAAMQRDFDVARLARWLGPKWLWTAEEVDPATILTGKAQANAQAELAAGTTKVALLIIDSPLAASSPAMWIGNSRVPVQWLMSPTTLLATSPGLSVVSADGSNAWEPTLPMRASGSLVTRAMMSHEASSPLTRWRVRLVLDGLSPMPLDAALDAETSGELLPKFEDESLELLASQYEDRWQVALGRLYLQDKQLAKALRQRLGAFVMVDNRLPVPAWEQNLATLEQLLEDLLNPDIPAKRRAEFVRAFLKEQPEGVAWITDDGGLLVKQQATQSGKESADGAESRRPWATVALANCTSEARTGMITTRDPAAPAAEPVTIPPNGVIRLTTPLLSLSQEMMNLGASGRAVGLAGAGDLDVSIGNWSSRLAILDGPLPVQPPGLATGPFQPDMTMREWLAGAASEADPKWATAALLQRVSVPQAGDLPHRAWQIFVEAKVGGFAGVSEDKTIAAMNQSEKHAQQKSQDDSIVMYVGSPGVPTAAWKIGRDGTITSLLHGERAAKNELAEVSGSQVDTARVEVLGDRWTARIALPAGSIEEDGLLRIGLQRIDPRGVRSSWPRAITPWQTEPSRAVVDTTKW